MDGKLLTFLVIDSIAKKVEPKKTLKNLFDYDERIMKSSEILARMERPKSSDTERSTCRTSKPDIWN